MEGWITQLRKGVLELAVLSLLRRGQAYGYEILQRLDREQPLAVSESTLYPVLVRLADDGLLKVRIVRSPQGPSRRYYRLTRMGASRLKEMVKRWREVEHAVDLLLEAEVPAVENRK